MGKNAPASDVVNVRALLAGRTIEVDGAKVAMLHGPKQAPARPIDPPFLIGTSGPKGEATARELGTGVIASRPVVGFDWSVWLTFGTVLDEGEDLDTERVLRSAGPGAAVAYHAGYERQLPMFGALPDAAKWQASVEEVDPADRHLEVHRGHLTELNRHDRKVMTGSDRGRVESQWYRCALAQSFGGRCPGGRDRGRVSTCR